MPQLFRLLLLVSGLLSGLSLHAQDAWSAFNQDRTRADLWSIAYGDNTLVAVGKSGTILSYNYDDRAWLPRDSGGDAWLVGVGHGNGRFIVVGDQGIILTSDDAGETWTPRVSGTTIRLNAVAHGGGRWLAVGEQGVVLTSIDGSTWEARPSLGEGFLRGLAYGRDRFFIGGARGRIHTTADASTFTPLSISIGGSATTQDIEAIACSPERIFIAGSSGLAATSTDLVTWNSRAPAPQGTFRGLALRNPREASAVGDRLAFYFVDNQGSDYWAGASVPIGFLATAAVQGKEEVVCVGLEGKIARSPLTTAISVVADAYILDYGGTTRLRVVSNGTPTAYQWRRDGIPLPGATGPELVLTNVTAADAGEYSVIVSFGAGSNFASGARIVVLSNGQLNAVDPTFTYPFDEIPSVAHPLPEGKLLVCRWTRSTPSDLGIAQINRLNANGSVDAAFQITPATVITGEIKRLQTLPDGRIYVFGRFSVGASGLVAVLRLLPDGAIDSSFDNRQLNPSATVEYIAATTDGAVYFGQSDARIYRHTADGRRDSVFPPLTGQLMGIDSRDRLVVRATLLQRYLPDGTLDPTYTASDGHSNSVMASPFLHYRLTDSGLHVLSAVYGRAGAMYSFRRYLPDGGLDPAYGVVPTPVYGSIDEIFRYVYRPDGGLWITSGRSPSYTSGVRLHTLTAYTPQGKYDYTHYMQAPSNMDFDIVATGADGSAYAYLGERIARRTFVRLQALVGTPGRLTNLSVRAHVDSTANQLIAGFVTAGTGPARALLRAIGPGLASFGVANVMPNPRLTLQWNGAVQAANDDWDAALASRFSALGAFPLAAGSRDAALEEPILAGNYTSVISPADAAGVALAEIYEVPPAAGSPSRRIVNLSARSEVTPGRPLILGFTVGGATPLKVFIRAVGPSLAAFGVPDRLADPTLTLHRSTTPIWENDNWPSDYAATALAVGAFALTSGSKDSAMQVTLIPGSYTAVVTGGTGNALVEVYEVP